MIYLNFLSEKSKCPLASHLVNLQSSTHLYIICQKSGSYDICQEKKKKSMRRAQFWKEQYEDFLEQFDVVNKRDHSKNRTFQYK